MSFQHSCYVNSRQFCQPWAKNISVDTSEDWLYPVRQFSMEGFVANWLSSLPPLHSLTLWVWREQSENSCCSEHIVKISLIPHPTVNRIVLRLNKMLQQEEEEGSRRRRRRRRKKKNTIRRTEPRERAERTYKVLAFLADVLESFFIHLCMLCMPPLPALFPLTLHPLPKTAAVWNWVRVPAPAYWAPQLVWVLLLCICSCKLFCYISWFCYLDLARTCWMARRCRDWLVIVNGGIRRSGGGARRRGRDILVHWFCSTLLSFALFP